MAIGSTTPGDRDTDRWAPHISIFPFSEIPEIKFKHGKIAGKGEKI
jgi:hypothetical protein